MIAASGVVKEAANYKYGVVLRDPYPRMLEALGDYAYQVARKGIDDEDLSRKVVESAAESRRAIFEKNCLSVLDAEIKASVTSKVYR